MNYCKYNTNILQVNRLNIDRWIDVTLPERSVSGPKHFTSAVSRYIKNRVLEPHLLKVFVEARCLNSDLIKRTSC